VAVAISILFSCDSVFADLGAIIVACRAIFPVLRIDYFALATVACDFVN
jgi:hypothetical protein